MTRTGWFRGWYCLECDEHFEQPDNVGGGPFYDRLCPECGTDRIRDLDDDDRLDNPGHDEARLRASRNVLAAARVLHFGPRVRR